MRIESKALIATIKKWQWILMNDRQETLNR